MGIYITKCMAYQGIHVKAIYLINILICMFLKLKFIQLALRTSSGFLLFVPVFLLGLDYFSMFNLKDTLVVLLVFLYFTSNNRLWRSYINGFNWSRLEFI